MNMSQTATKLPFSLDDLSDYLRDHPSVFQQHSELLELISLSDNRGASSLLERQVGVLKERLNAQRAQQAEFFQVARENEEINNSFTEIVCQLIGFTHLSEFATEFPSALRKTFAIDEVSFKTTQSVDQRPNEKTAYQDTLRRLNKNRALCDNRWPSSVMSLFFSTNIKSAALVPLLKDKSEQAIGVLALGSCDPERYSNELGTAHLDRLGLMTGMCLARLLTK